MHASLCACFYNKTQVLEHRCGACADVNRIVLPAAWICLNTSKISAASALTSEAEEGEEVLRLGLAAGQVLNGGGQRGQGKR